MISPFLQKLMFVRQFNISNGKVDILGNDYVLLDALALLEMQKIDEEKLYNVLKSSAFKNISETVRFANVYKNVKDVFLVDIAKIGKKMGKSDKGTLTTLQELFNVYGLGTLEIIKLDNANKKALLKLRDSTIAKEYKKKYGKAPGPVDMIAAGILAGTFSYVFQKKVDCVEKSCLAQGAGYCQFEVA